jgi:uncharacterized membrane protein
MKGRDPSAGASLPTNRIEALGDGIFAIAMTLLILEFKVPAVSLAAGAPPILGELMALWPQVVCYATSFLILGVFWIGHHTQFHFVERSDRTMLWINLVFFMTVAFIPFSTALLGVYRTQRAAIVVYAGNMAACGLTLYGHWRYVVARGLTDTLEPGVAAAVGRRILWGVAAYSAGAAIGMVKPPWALFVDAAIPFLYLPGGQIDRWWIMATPPPTHDSEARK